MGEAVAIAGRDFPAEEFHPWGHPGGSFLGQGFPVAARDLPVGEHNSKEFSRGKSLTFGVAEQITKLPEGALKNSAGVCVLHGRDQK